MAASILYAPFYMPQHPPEIPARPQAFIEETLAAMQLIRPDFDRGDVIAATASRYDYAQTVCTPGLLRQLPPMRSAAQRIVPGRHLALLPGGPLDLREPAARRPLATWRDARP